MELIRFNIGDTVRVIGESRIGEITEIGFSDRMMEHTYIVSYKDSKRKVLEHQLETAPLVFSIKDFDAAAAKISQYYEEEIITELSTVNQDAAKTFIGLVNNVIAHIRTELTGGDNAGTV